MLCPTCNQPLYAKALGIQNENDNTPDLETKSYFVQELTCSNKKCSYKTQIRHPQPIIKEV